MVEIMPVWHGQWWRKPKKTQKNRNKRHLRDGLYFLYKKIEYPYTILTDIPMTENNNTDEEEYQQHLAEVNALMDAMDKAEQDAAYEEYLSEQDDIYFVEEYQRLLREENLVLDLDESEVVADVDEESIIDEELEEPEDIADMIHDVMANVTFDALSDAMMMVEMQDMEYDMQVMLENIRISA
jgi:hypothetical protein